METNAKIIMIVCFVLAGIGIMVFMFIDGKSKYNHEKKKELSRENLIKELQREGWRKIDVCELVVDKFAFEDLQNENRATKIRREAIKSAVWYIEEEIKNSARTINVLEGVDLATEKDNLPFYVINGQAKVVIDKTEIGEILKRLMEMYGA